MTKSYFLTRKFDRVGFLLKAHTIFSIVIVVMIRIVVVMLMVMVITMIAAGMSGCRIVRFLFVFHRFVTEHLDHIDITHVRAFFHVVLLTLNFYVEILQLNVEILNVFRISTNSTLKT